MRCNFSESNLMWNSRVRQSTFLETRGSKPRGGSGVPHTSYINPACIDFGRSSTIHWRLFGPDMSFSAKAYDLLLQENIMWGDFRLIWSLEIFAIGELRKYFHRYKCKWKNLSEGQNCSVSEQCHCELVTSNALLDGRTDYDICIEGNIFLTLF